MYTEKEQTMYDELRKNLDVELMKAEYGGILTYAAEGGSQLSGLTDDELRVMVAQGVKIIDPYDYWHNTGNSPERRRAQLLYHDTHVMLLTRRTTK